jgi:HlyD family secretion protein
MNFERKYVLMAATAIVAAGLLAWAFAPRPVAVETSAVTKGRYEQAIEEDGRTRVRDRYTVSAPVAAQLTRITLREGDAVRAGDAVAVLLPVMSAMVDERSTREARARLQAAEANVTRAGARPAAHACRRRGGATGASPHREAGARRISLGRPARQRDAGTGRRTS